MSTASKKAKFCDLKINRDLLDSKFEGYKLCLDQLRTGSRKLPFSKFRFLDICRDPSSVKFFVDVKAISPSTDQWSYQHLRLFSGHNHLHIDPWTINQNRRDIYALLDDGIYRCSVEKVRFLSFLALLPFMVNSISGQAYNFGTPESLRPSIPSRFCLTYGQIQRVLVISGVRSRHHRRRFWKSDDQFHIRR